MYACICICIYVVWRDVVSFDVVWCNACMCLCMSVFMFIYVYVMHAYMCAMAVCKHLWYGWMYALHACMYGMQICM